MANFESAFARLKGYEGGYMNDPDDAGGETYCGIARRFHPYWLGWKLIDSLKKDGRLSGEEAGKLGENNELAAMVSGFYKGVYWEPFAGDLIASQAVAEELLEISVHVRPELAVMFLQRALNALNKQGALWADVAVDGQMGPMTVDGAKRCDARGLSGVLSKAINCQQGVYYLERCEKDVRKEKWFAGWMSRVDLEGNA
jgi:lysozyme family protein